MKKDRMVLSLIVVIIGWGIGYYCGNNYGKRYTQYKDQFTELKDDNDNLKSENKKLNQQVNSLTIKNANTSNTSSNTQSTSNNTNSNKDTVYNYLYYLLNKSESPIFDLNSTAEEIQSYEDKCTKETADLYKLSVDEVNRIYYEHEANKVKSK